MKTASVCSTCGYIRVSIQCCQYSARVHSAPALLKSNAWLHVRRVGHRARIMRHARAIRANATYTASACNA
eukprot:3421658-Pleurochrysis_carterae.AAC.5